MAEEIHEDEESTVRIDYGEVLKAVAGGVVGSGLMSLTPIGILLPMFTALKALQKPQQPNPSNIDNIREIIKAGKAQGVKEMEIKVDKSIAGKIDLSLLEDLGVDLEIERQNITLIKVRYA